MNTMPKSVNSLVRIALGLTLLGWVAIVSLTTQTILAPQSAAAAAGRPSEAPPEVEIPASVAGPSLAAAPLAHLTSAQGRMLRVRSMSGSPGSELKVPVEYFAQGDERELRFSLRFDPALLDLGEVSLSLAGASLELDRSRAAEGLLGVAITLGAESRLASGLQHLLDLGFRADGTRQRAQSAIEFSDTPFRRAVIGTDAVELNVGYTSGVVAVAAAIEGDVAPRPNGSEDGALTIGDWIQAGRFVARLDEAEEGSEFQRADAAPRANSGDGQIRLADWVQVGRYAEGLDSPQPAAGPTGTTSIAEANAIVAASLAGDSSVSQARAVRALSATFTRGQDNTLVIEFDALGDENAVSFSLNYNPAHIAFVRAQLGSGVPTQGEPVLNINTAQLGSGRVGFAIALRGGRVFSAGTRQLLIVTFTVPTSGNQNTSIVSFVDDPIRNEVVNANADPVEATFSQATLSFTPTVNAVPVINSISPNFVIVGGPDFTLIVNGADFVNGASVRVDGADRATRFVNSGELQAFLLASDIDETGVLEITVANPPPGGGTSNTVNLSVNNPLPTVSDVTPKTFGVNQQGTTITVTGSQFVPGSVVRWNGQSRPTTFISNTQLTAAIPPTDFDDAGTAAITVFNGPPGGGVSNEFQVTVRPSSPLPRISMISPDRRVPGDIGFELTVIGTNFAEDAFVRVDGEARPTTFVSSIELKAQIPASDIAVARTLLISVTNPPPGGGNSNNLPLEVSGTPNPSPTLNSISPSSVVSGGGDFTLTLNGANFIEQTVALFNGVTRPTTFISSTELEMTIFASDIASAGTAQITVSTPPPGGGQSVARQLTITLGSPVISFLSPNSALAGGDGFMLTVIGTSFTEQSVVRWNGEARTTTFVDGTELRAQIPATDIAEPGTAQINVANGVDVSNTVNFFISEEENAVPRINSLSPSQAVVGGPGFTLIVNGTGFYGGSIVRWNGSPRPTTFVSVTEVQAQISASDIANVGTAAVTVFNGPPGGGTSNTVTFSINQQLIEPPVIATITPSTVNAGGPGFTLAVEGSNFVPGSVVQVNSENRPTTFISATQLTAQVSADDIAFGGAVTVNVFNPPPGGGTSNVVNLTILNPTPVITSLDPAVIGTPQLGSPNVSVTINGAGFVPGAVARVNGQNRQTAFVNPNRLSVVILNTDRTDPGTLEISVVNPSPGGGASNVVPLEVRLSSPLPRLTSITPESANAGAAGFTLVLTGTNFSPDAVVRFGNRDLPTEVLSSTTATASVSSTDLLLGGLVQVRVFNPPPGGGLSGAVLFAINSPAPQITSVTPGQLVGGSQPVIITVNGANFVGASVVRFNGVDKPTTFIGTTQLTAQIDPIDLVGITSAQVTVFTPEPGGGTSNAITVQVTPGQAPAPVITSLTPGSVIAGSAAITLQVDGSNFAPTSVIRVNGVARGTTFVNTTRLTTTLTAGDLATVTTLVITVFTPAPGGGTSNAVNFGVLSAPPPAPNLISLAPSTGSVGSPFVLTVNGGNFVQTSIVQVNGTPRVTTFISSTQLQAQITAADVTNAGTLTVTVFTPAPGGGTSNSLPLVIQAGPNPPPMISSLNPFVATAGGAGFQLTVIGSNFTGSSVVRWNGLNQPTTFVSSTQLRAQISAALIAAEGTAQVTVFTPAPGGGLSNTLIFLVDSANPPDCRTICFRSAQYFVRNINRVPNGLVHIGGVNANTPLPVDGNEALIKSTLQGGTSAPQQLNAQYVASQLSFIIAGSAATAGAMQGSPRCYGVSFTPVLLSNNAIITPNTTLGEIFAQIRSAFSENRTQDMPQLTAILLLLNGTDPFSTCNRAGAAAGDPPPSFNGESDLLAPSRLRRNARGRLEIIEQ